MKMWTRLHKVCVWFILEGNSLVEPEVVQPWEEQVGEEMRERGDYHTVLSD